MPCTIVVNQVDVAPAQLRLTGNELVVGKLANAHLWSEAHPGFTLWLEAQEAPLLDAATAIKVNGKRQHQVRLGAGDCLRFGDSELIYLGPGDEAEFNFRWRKGQPLTALPTPAPKKTSARPWLMIALIATVLMVPWWLVQFGPQDSRPFSPERGKQPAGVSSPLQHWLAGGPLHPAHQQAQCGDCHTRPGAPVDNRSCFACHTMQRHFSKEKTGNHPQCVGCHLEHNEPSNLIEKDNRLCTQCHNNLALVAQVLSPDAEHSLTDFAGFDEGHPDFPSAPASPFNFNHRQHLDPALKSDKAPLSCRSCHQWQNGNPVPVTFARSCNQCHTTSDKKDQRQWPHGDLAQLVVFARQNGLADRRALAVVNGKTCRSCHRATLKSTQLKELQNTRPWQYPHAGFNARFSHKRHEGRLHCADCHQAAQSEQSDDSLLPRRENCVGCHNQQATPPLNQCALCHQFHHVDWPEQDDFLIH